MPDKRVNNCGKFHFYGLAIYKLFIRLEKSG